MSRPESSYQIDLSRGIIRKLPADLASLPFCIGGRGNNVEYLYQNLSDGIDPSGPENILLFSPGLLTGSSAPSASRVHVNALSPLTGILGSSNIGGHTGAWLASCGVRSLIISGRSATPVFLYIHENGAEIRDARFLWGRDAFETQDLLAERFREKKVRILTIGPAGENGVRFACIMSERDHAAGRTGMGTVMGAKHLKAIVISKGHYRPFSANLSEAKEAARRYIRKIKASADYQIFSEYGGAGYLDWAQQMGIVGTRNYRQRRFDRMENVDGRRLKPHVIRSKGCFGCPVRCKAELNLGKKATRPEFEPMINLGARCGLDDPEAVVRLDNLCSRLGMDSTSAAAAIGFAMDLFDRNLLNEKDTGGMKLKWGDVPIMERLVRQMAEGRGLGGILAQGVRRAAEIIGRGAERYAAHVKGLDLTAYHPSAIMGTALGYAISSRGGDYNNVYASLEYGWTPQKARRIFGTEDAADIHSPGGKGKLVRRAVLVNIALDALGLCKVPALSLIGDFDLISEAELTSAVTGLHVTADDLFAAADRIAALERMFNLRHGLSEKDDDLPRMFYEEEADGQRENSPSNDPAAPPKLAPDVLRGMVREFYSAMGWDALGVPTAETLKRLGLNIRPAP